MAFNSEALKIGIMGGTFNPIHNGHLIIAENAAQQYGLDKILFLPNGNPPHKDGAGILTAKHRCNMVSLAIAGNEKFELSTKEAFETEVCYTYRTLSELKEEHPTYEYYFIMGADSLFEFGTWRNPDIICQKASLLVAVRDDYDERAVRERMKILNEKYGASVYELITPNFSVSSHNIRDRIKNQKTIRYLVPEEVREYITKENLYLI